jgi:Uma2 family endonuclease
MLPAERSRVWQARFKLAMMVLTEFYVLGVRMGMPLAKMTLAEFLEWERAEDGRHEFYRGETFAMVGGTARHNRVILNLASRIGEHLDGTQCQVFAENMKVQLASEAVLYPDVMVTCGKADAGDEQSVNDPKLVIEVLSPSTKGYDKRDKFILYRTLSSLREYVLIDPATRVVEVFTLADAGTWLLTDQSEAGDLRLASIDCAMPMAQVFKGVAREEA